MVVRGLAVSRLAGSGSRQAPGSLALEVGVNWRAEAEEKANRTGIAF
jgi:hypothetical protein